MIKYKVFYARVEDGVKHDDSVRTFIDELCESGHTFINVSTIIYGISEGYLNRMRTEVVYRENITREVLVEKTENNNGQV